MPSTMQANPTDAEGNPLAGFSKSGKKKKYSNNKKNWRKFVDVSDVKKQQEESLRDVLMGGAAQDKSNDSLFFVDKKPSIALKSMMAGKKRKSDGKVPHYMKAQQPHPHTKTVSSKKQKLSANAKKMDTASDNSVAFPVATESRLATKENLSNKNDLWGEQTPKETETVVQLGKIVTKGDTVVRKPLTMSSEIIKGAVAVEVAHPGQSYNPAFNDHQLAMDVAAERIDRENKKFQFFQEKAGASASKIMSYNTYLDEMKIVPVESEDEDLGAQSETDYSVPAHKNKALLAMRKTRAQKNKEKKREEEERLRASTKAENQLMNELYRLKTLKKEVEQDEEEHAVTMAARDVDREEAMTKPKKLGKYKFEDTHMDVQLPEELSGSLRLMKAETNLIRDRFKSMQARNMMEVRKKVVFKRRYKMKEYEKRSFKSNQWTE
eukprot:CFRG0389T1